MDTFHDIHMNTVYVYIRDGRYGRKVLSRSFLAFIAITIKVTIKNIKQFNSMFWDYFFLKLHTFETALEKKKHVYTKPY